MRDVRETLLLMSPRETAALFPALDVHPEVSHARRLRIVMGEFADSYDGLSADEYYRIVREIGFEESWGESFESPIGGGREQQFVMLHPRGIVLVWETLDGRVGSARWYANYRGPREFGDREGGVQVLAMDGREGIRWWVEQLCAGDLVAPMLVTPPVWSLHHGIGTGAVEHQRVAYMRRWPERVRTMLNLKLPALLPPGDAVA